MAWLEKPFVRSESDDYTVRPLMKLTTVLSAPRLREIHPRVMLLIQCE